jgi:hypothetical protein
LSQLAQAAAISCSSVALSINISRLEE